ncbi:lyase family protein [Oceaniglobus roseus]|uniref:lyase family protein n=1 Tax=Oceaniglobus roseus TaxID=1737570 RepID=UPI000C7EA403|nr:lyase family protein [Kandeliimicrobium roseum]
MTATPFDSAIFRDLLHDAATQRLMSDTAAVRAMLLVEGTLAKVQGARGVIPETAAKAIQRASLELQVDPGGLSAETGTSGVPVPALVAAFRKAMEAPEHAQFVHWGATSQDIMDTALVLRLRQMLLLWESRLTDTLHALAALADAHAETPMAGRTYGQIASPTSFGAVVASWGQPLLRHLDRLHALRPRLLCVSLSGAAGTASALGPDPAGLRADLARGLGLDDPGGSWHSTRDTMGELSGWIAAVTGSLGKMGRDLSLMAQSGRGEVRLGTTGGSSTMPQKQNPVGPELLVALAHHAAALNTAMQGAQVHGQQRDGAAWFTEWLSLPPMLMAMGRATALALDIAQTTAPEPEAMARQIDDGTGLIWAEALSFALARRMPRPEAQAVLKALCREAQQTGAALPDLMHRDHPGQDWRALCTPSAQLGTAPGEARQFARAARALAKVNPPV